MIPTIRTVSPQQIEAARHDTAIRNSIHQRLVRVDWDAVERRAFEKHPVRPKPELHGFQITEPVSPALDKLQVDIAKQNLPKREPKRKKHVLP